MAKGQKRSSREAKKPKQEKKAPPAVSSFEKGSVQVTSGPKRK